MVSRYNCRLVSSKKVDHSWALLSGAAAASLRAGELRVGLPGDRAEATVAVSEEVVGKRTLLSGVCGLDGIGENVGEGRQCFRGSTLSQHNTTHAHTRSTRLACFGSLACMYVAHDDLRVTKAHGPTLGTRGSERFSKRNTRS